MSLRLSVFCFLYKFLKIFYPHKRKRKTLAKEKYADKKSDLVFLRETPLPWTRIHILAYLSMSQYTIQSQPFPCINLIEFVAKSDHSKLCFIRIYSTFVAVLFLCQTLHKAMYEISLPLGF